VRSAADRDGVLPGTDDSPQVQRITGSRESCSSDWSGRRQQSHVRRHAQGLRQYRSYLFGRVYSGTGNL